MEADWGVGSWLQYGAVSAAFVYGARALYNAYNGPPQEPEGGARYLPWPGSSELASPGASMALSATASLVVAAAAAQLEPGGGSSGGGNVGGADALQPLTHDDDTAADGGGGPLLVSASDVVVVDCTHPFLPTLTHHRGDNNPAGLKPSDTSTGLVLNALAGSRSWGQPELAAVVSRRFVTTNHFDVDAFLSAWAFCNRQAAAAHEPVLRHAARIGDFREAFLSPDLITRHGAHDGVTFIREAYTALKLVCWLNTLEARLFSAPYETQGDCDAKMAYFLPRFGAVLEDPESSWADWQAEYSRVVSGFDLLAGPDCMVDSQPALGLAVISAPEPLHYTSLFSHTTGCDVVLMMYDDNRYELECKYTQFVRVTSRPVWPRLDMAPLAAVLNSLEVRLQQQQQQSAAAAAAVTAAGAGAAAGAAEGQQQQQHQQQQHAGLYRTGSNGSGSPAGFHSLQQQQLQGGMRWVANSFTDTGPLLRLQAPGEALSKAQRYGQPYERPIHASAIPPHKMQAIVQSFLGFGLQGLTPLVGGCQWPELQELNHGIRWQDWASCILQQASRGELDGAAAAAAGVSCSGAGGGPPPVGLSPPPSTPRRPLLHPEAWQQQQPQQQQRQQRHLAVEMQPQGGLPDGAAAAAGGALPSPGCVVPPSPGLPLVSAEAPPVLSQPSTIASPEALAALAAALPPLHRGNPWLLIYSTARDGISLATLMRKAEKVAPTLLLVRDGGGAVFGAYVTDAWHCAPRFYGTGESFVFQLEPSRRAWPWVQLPGLRNDFFQHATHEALGVGGAGHWAITLDEDLLRGSSGPCDTFASPCLSASSLDGDFQVLGVELWHVH